MATDTKQIRLSPDTLRLSADHFYRTFFLELKVDVGLEQIFEPWFWSLVHADLRKYDVVRVIGQNRKFDILITVAEKSATEVWMRPFNYIPPGSELQRAFKLVAQAAAAREVQRLAALPAIEFPKGWDGAPQRA